jgi:lipopolysaccharide cholinephosphotransferase
MKEISSVEIKRILLDLMCDIHQFCITNDIKYSLAFGSLIGTMRHQGFIPWDDDIDIYMMREDYDRFRKTYKPSKNYMKLNDCEKDDNYHRTFLKLEDTRTVVYEVSVFDYLGISIDIFPVDNLFDDLEKSLKLCKKVEFYRKIHIIKSLTLRNDFGLLKKIVMGIGKVLFMTFGVHDVTMKMVRLSKNGKDNSKYVTILDMNHNNDLIFERSIYENVILRAFEDKEFYTMKDADIWLRKRYGNYMELPPIEKRENGSCHEFEGTYFKD